MVNIKLRYLVQDVDRHGNVRSYVRLAGKPKVRIRGLPGSEEFMAAYQAALSQSRSRTKARNTDSQLKTLLVTFAFPITQAQPFKRWI
jgi:hypothetical protein